MRGELKLCLEDSGDCGIRGFDNFQIGNWFHPQTHFEPPKQYFKKNERLQNICYKQYMNFKQSWDFRFPVLKLRSRYHRARYRYHRAHSRYLRTWHGSTNLNISNIASNGFRIIRILFSSVSTIVHNLFDRLHTLNRPRLSYPPSPLPPSPFPFFSIASKYIWCKTERVSQFNMILVVGNIYMIKLSQANSMEKHLNKM